MNKKFWFVFLAVFTLLSCNENIEQKDNNPVVLADSLDVDPIENNVFGFNLDDFDVYHDTVKNGWTLSHMLLPYGVNQYLINLTEEKAKDSLVGLKYIVSGKPFTVLSQPGDTLKKAQYVVYEPDVFSYIIFNYSIEDSIQVSRKQRDVSVNRKMVFGEIEQNSNLSIELAKSFDHYIMTAALADAMEGVFAWSVDFFKLQVGDQFVAVYDEKSVEEIPYAVERINHVFFKHNGQPYYAFHFVTDSVENISGYYDEKGREMKRPFLMSPVKFARISSSYNLNRIHPIYKSRRAHLGTDYAAPTGTPILATADGTVTKASRSGGNGIYVKLRHNNVYETQYLHMSRIADGVRSGVRVKQGQVIGYVGSTGAATGPHVCYRFWKHGKQVNHRSEKFPKSEPMDTTLIPAYLEYIKPLKKELDEKAEAMSQLKSEEGV